MTRSPKTDGFFDDITVVLVAGLVTVSAALVAVLRLA